MVDRLFGLLRGPALEVACGLPDQDLENYESLVAKLEGQFGPGRQAGKHLAELRNRVKNNEESFRELGRAINRLCSLAYPESTYEERQRHAKIYFVEAIPESELRVMIATARPNNLDEAICLAEEFEGIRRLEKQRNAKLVTNRNNVRNVNTGNQDTNETSRLDRIENLVERLSAETENRYRQYRSGRSRGQQCWGCGSERHFVRDCPQSRDQEKNGSRSGPRDMHRPL
jgi:hypothetical protein